MSYKIHVSHKNYINVVFTIKFCFLFMPLQCNPSFEVNPCFPETWPFKRDYLSSGIEINSFVFKETLSCVLSKGIGLSKGVSLYFSTCIWIQQIRSHDQGFIYKPASGKNPPLLQSVFIVGYWLEPLEDKLNFRQEMHIFSPNVQRAS